MDILLGLQWGDEGKGKIVDFLAPNYNMIARFQGGPNAGHTLNFGGARHVLRQIPSGVFRADVKNLIGNGSVIDLVTLKKEIEELQQKGVPVVNNLFISKKAALILPTHRLLDAAQEQRKGDKKIGSTLRGISPTYQDKVGRTGLRIGNLLQADFTNRYQVLKQKHIEELQFLQFTYDLEPLEKEFFEAADFIKKLQLVDSEYFINDEIDSGGLVLAEGAQGTLLDIDFGSYPFVTSSNTSVAGACTGLGVAPNQVSEVMGIFKAYCTRVGSGPFPSELQDETGLKMAKIGNEFGSVTGRPRRCGWLDLPALRYAVMINGVTQMFMMKADVLNSFEELKVCTHYELANGEKTDQMPFDIASEPVKPIYKTFKGWNQELKDIKSFDDLPQELLDYIDFIEQQMQTPITLVSYGADRQETLLRENLFNLNVLH
ncbi:MAG: adenylosuccinate synthase [Bacteroidetes bacterium]|nr:MAG: adenylosuccinate synthase [Bacteroidota bacterium]